MLFIVWLLYIVMIHKERSKLDYKCLFYWKRGRGKVRSDGYNLFQYGKYISRGCLILQVSFVSV